MFIKLVVLISAYLLGSIPTAILYSKTAHAVDIRNLGDGNMGARNTAHMFGFWAGFLVSIADILKGLFAVLLAILLGMPLVWQMAAGMAAIIGHDFPVFAQFQGGKGLATTIGVFLGLFPIFSLIGAAIYGLIYLFFRNSDLSAGISMGTLALLVYFSDAPIIAVGFIVVVLLFIPLKKWLDRSRLSKI